MLSKVIRRYFSGKNYTNLEGFKSTKGKKMSKHNFIRRELKENPEFFKAFPHLQKPMYEKENPHIDGFEYSENIRNKDFFDKQEL